MSKATLYDKFNTDKESTLGVIQEFLQSTPKSPTIAPEDLGQYRFPKKKILYLQIPVKLTNN